MSLTQFLHTQGFFSFEGYSQQIYDQVNDLIDLTKGSAHIMEIGFNAGHSSEIFLRSNPQATVTSFDLGTHPYTAFAKQYIDKKYPCRHTLILGDSTVTVPTYYQEHPDNVFDVIFIDGGHEYSIAKADLENGRKLANKDTIVMMDDTIYKTEWEQEFTIGPTKAWIEQLESGLMTEINHVEYMPGRGMSWGKYNF
jgi:predicted O-methyltransferase YrrM